VKNGRFKMFAILFLAFATILQTFPGNMWGGVSRLYAAQGLNLVSSATSGYPNALYFTFKSREDLDSIKGVRVNDVDYTYLIAENKYAISNTTGKYWFSSDKGVTDYYVYLSKLKSNDIVKFITNDGYLQLTISDPDSWGSVHNPSSVKFVEDTAKDPEPPKEPEQPKQSGKITLTVARQFGGNEIMLTIYPSPNADDITGVLVGGVSYEKVGSKFVSGYAGGHAYYLEGNDKLYIPTPQNGAIITLVYADGNKHSFTYKEGASSIEELAETPAPKVLKLRLRGYFEAAMVGQRKYDGVSSASLAGANSNKNSDVVLEGTYAENPEDKDWQLFEKLGIRDVHPRLILDEKSGMKGRYNSFDDKSQFTLEGTPAEPGKYVVKASVEINGETVTTDNSLTFSVYDTNGTLSEYLNDDVISKTPSFRKMQDDKYIWDMEPWVITKFGGDNETVTVPTAVKAWYGSHTSGTYGELGFAAVDEIPKQTLIVDKNTNLTLVNMKVLSSVKIIARNGGVLNLMDSSVHGKIEVENGGKLQVNYDVYHNKITQGSSINGQVELKDGGILENSLIYSNTNYLPNGQVARHNVEPVVKVTGNATIRGKVYIRGDEAPTGTDPKTGKTYTGQPALSVENATLNVEKDANLWLAGGGKMMITTYGAPGLKLNNGTVTGEGNLISFAGTSTREEGRPAVEGNGTLQTAKMYLVGGDTYDKTKGGKVLSEGVKIE